MRIFYVYLICTIFNFQSLYGKEAIVINKTSTINPFKGSSQTVPPLDKIEVLNSGETIPEENVTVPIIEETDPSETMLKEVLATPDSSDIESDKAIEEDGKNVSEYNDFTLTNDEINSDSKSEDESNEDSSLPDENIVNVEE